MHEHSPLYIVCGALDHTTFSANEMDLDRYLKKGFDLTYVEYRGRGHEHFSDELIKIFDWISLKSTIKLAQRNRCCEHEALGPLLLVD